MLTSKERAQLRAQATTLDTTLMVGKNGITEQDIIPMIRKINIAAQDDHCLVLNARICCQNPTLNPVQLSAAIAKYLPELTPDFVTCCRNEIYTPEETIFR